MFIDKMIKKTLWYRNFFVDFDHKIYPDDCWRCECFERDFDLVNLGSSSAKYAFKYEGLGIKAMNWAQQPQTLTEDFILLKSFHSILRRKGIVLITIMPFTGINKPVTAQGLMRYIPNLQSEVLNDQPLKLEAYRLYNYPLIMWRSAIKTFVRYLLRKNKKVSSKPQVLQNMNFEELEMDARRWMCAWKSQFNILDYDAPLTKENEEGRKVRVKLMQEIIDFCTKHEYIPVYVIPPVTQHLQKHFTSQFVKTYITSYLEEVNRDVQLLDYSKSIELQDASLYFNSFFLNEQGAKIFTKRVLSDLNLIK